MTYLELVQYLHRETGTGGPQPSTVIGQVGEAARLVYWIQRAELEIQNVHNDWDFLWSQTTFDTAIGTSDYAFPANAKTIDEDTIFVDSLGIQLGCVDYLAVKDDPRDLSQGVPYRVILLPSDTFRVEAVPDAIYTVRFDYFVQPTEMIVDDATLPTIPERYHLAIVGKAMTMYAMYENAPEIMQSGTQMFGEWFEAMQSNHLPGHRDMHKQAEGNYWRVEVE